jgi:uncharacterized protein (DUF1499 family)
MKRKMMFAFILAVLSIALVLAYIRMAPSDVDIWHQDPETAATTGKPNEYRITGDAAIPFNVNASELALLVDEFIRRQPRIKHVSGDPDSRMISYVQRSSIMGYPDYITIKVSPTGSKQSKLEILSRSRFGHSDLGVNKRRIDQWIAAIQSLIAG